jgi:hypothetical protein
MNSINARFFPDDLDDIHVPPPVRVPDGRQAGMTQFHAHGVRVFGQDGVGHQLGALPGHMGRADQKDLFFTMAEPVERLVLCCGLFHSPGAFFRFG